MTRGPARGRRLAAALAVVLLSGCTYGTAGQGSTAGGGTTPSPGAAGTAPKIGFRDCTKQIVPMIQDQPGGGRDLTFDCGTMPVPKDHAKPAAGTLSMFVIRARLAGQRDRIGSLVINPGGPGGSGVEAAIGLALQLPEAVLRRFDLVGFDPRGVGLSEPVTCISGALKDESTAADPDARDDAAYAAQKALAQRVADGCYARYGAGLARFNTTATARDLDLLRQALGDAKLSYLGYSYGTLIGSVYATLYPNRIRSFVLDGAVDPTADERGNAEAQARGFEDAFAEFAKDCAGKGAACPLGADPRGFLTRLLAKARTAPIASAQAGESRKATAGNVLLAAVAALYDKDDWPKLTTALADADRGNAAGVLALDDEYNQRSADGKFSNILDANVTINCADSAKRLTDATIKATITAWRAKYPLFGPPLAVGLITCQLWKAPREPLPTVRAPSAPAILVVGTRHDPATPYASAQRLTRALGHAVLLTWEGNGHTAYPKTPCVTNAVNAYLIAGTVPPPSDVCPR
ncbi:MAG TPA: alpha/beta hydrolase [Mycobacteriales bacterium]|nr:alpha/beta hydrolase [Mycobacteriales bacterium]